MVEDKKVMDIPKEDITDIPEEDIIDIPKEGMAPEEHVDYDLSRVASEPGEIESRFVYDSKDAFTMIENKDGKASTSWTRLLLRAD